MIKKGSKVSFKMKNDEWLGLVIDVDDEGEALIAVEGMKNWHYRCPAKDLKIVGKEYKTRLKSWDVI